MSGETEFEGNVKLLTSLIRAVGSKYRVRAEADVKWPDIYFEEIRLHSPRDPFLGSYIMPVVTLRTRPCRWAANSGCIMCGYRWGATSSNVSEDDLMAQIRNAVGKLNPVTYPAVVVTSNGSFLDPSEVSDSTRPRLLGLLREAGYQLVICETRPEFITSSRLDALVEACAVAGQASGRELGLSISIGLESNNEQVLQLCLNKGETLNSYLTAFNLLRSRGVGFDCYVLLGKPFLTAEEDISDAMETIQFAVEQGAEYVFVMVLNLMRGTLTAHMAEHGYYRLPSLWRAVQLLEGLPHRLRRYVQVKAFEHAPVLPNAFATTCAICEREVRSGLNFWNQTGDFQHIRDLPRCECRKRFVAHELEEKNDMPLDGRVGRILRAMAHELAAAVPDRRGRQWSAIC